MYKIIVMDTYRWDNVTYVNDFTNNYILIFDNKILYIF